jgi:hypothetical protein
MIDDATVCDECGATIPDTPGGGLANRHHAESCSLHSTWTDTGAQDCAHRHTTRVDDDFRTCDDCGATIRISVQTGTGVGAVERA